MGKGKERTIGQNQKNGEEGQSRGREKKKNIVIKGVDWNEGSNEGIVKEYPKNSIGNAGQQ